MHRIGQKTTLQPTFRSLARAFQNLVIRPWNDDLMHELLVLPDQYSEFSEIPFNC